MKGLLVILFLLFAFGDLPEVAKIRADYKIASGNKVVTTKLHNDLKEVKKKDDKVLVAYKGAVSTMMAKYTKGKSNKKELFKEGASLIEYAQQIAPANIEIRVIRMSIQENAPKFLKYNSNIEEDKKFIISNYSKVNSKEIREFVKNYVLRSDGFTASEKEHF